MNRGARKAWLVYGVVVSAVLLVAILGTVKVIRLDRSEQNRARQSGDDQQLRAALWRLDGALGAFVARQWGQCLPDEITGINQAFAPVPDYVLSFVAEPIDGAIEFWPGRPRTTGADLQRLQGARVETPNLAANPSFNSAEQILGSNSADLGLDYNLRNGDLAPRRRSNDNYMAQQLDSPLNRADLPPVLSNVAPLAGVWAGESGNELLLLRPALPGFEDGYQRVGVWIDWPRLENWMVLEIRDLMPDAEFELASIDLEETAAGRLASIPVNLKTPSRPSLQTMAWSRRDFPIAAAWLALLASLGGMAVFVHRTVALSERRARFVSAVTHELRTPLTTFRLYAQMLEDGMVPEEKRPEYLATLGTESERLVRVVESVLLWSKLERGAGRARRERIAALALIERAIPPLERRVAESSQEFQTSIDLPGSNLVEIDPQAFEQVLFNLIDNAVKYGARDGRVCLAAQVKSGYLVVSVDDDGAGVEAKDRKGVFEPFRRARRHQAGSQPGLGLGLPLARDLIRAQGGDLVHDGGSRFVVRLPVQR